MGNLLLLIVVALTVGAVVFGVMTLVTGGDPGLAPAEPDERATPLPADRPLVEGDVVPGDVRPAWRGYRMDQVDQTLRRLAYDIGYKSELIQVLEAEIIALREGRVEDADTLAGARASALGVVTASAVGRREPADAADETARRRRRPGRAGRDRRRGRRAAGRRGRPRDRPGDGRGGRAAAGEPVRRVTGPIRPRPGAGEVTATIIVDAPAERVFAAFIGWERQSDWIPLHQGAGGRRATAARAP